jgi:methylmalonyl-CoA mutase cobalamin-binding subunit
VVVFAGEATRSEGGARALADSLSATGIQVVYLGRERSVRRIALCAAVANADSVEVCVAGGGAVALLRELLRELRRLDGLAVSIVVRKVI